MDLMPLGDGALSLRAQAEHSFRHVERLHSGNHLDGKAL